MKFLNPMRRKEIVDLLEVMGLSYYHSKNPKSQRWKIPCSDITIRLILNYDDPDIFSSRAPSDPKWKVLFTTRWESITISPEEALEKIRAEIMHQFERHINKNYSPFNINIHKGSFEEMWTSSYVWGELKTVVPTEKPTYKPYQHVCKTQRNQNRPRLHRSSYAGKR